MDWVSNGKYTLGQCTDGAASMCSWVPAGLGNACDWLGNAQRRGMPTSSVPVVGSVACYGRGFGYSPSYGHVAVVLAVGRAGTPFSVRDANWSALGRFSTRWSSMDDVLGFLTPPGTPAPGPPAPEPVIPTPTDGGPTMNISEKRAFVRLAYLAALGREPESSETQDAWASRITDDAHSIDPVLIGICDSPEAKAWNTRLRAIVARG